MVRDWPRAFGCRTAFRAFYRTAGGCSTGQPLREGSGLSLALRMAFSTCSRNCSPVFPLRLRRICGGARSPAEAFAIRTPGARGASRTSALRRAAASALSLPPSAGVHAVLHQRVDEDRLQATRRGDDGPGPSSRVPSSHPDGSSLPLGSSPHGSDVGPPASQRARHQRHRRGPILRAAAPRWRAPDWPSSGSVPTESPGSRLSAHHPYAGSSAVSCQSQAIHSSRAAIRHAGLRELHAPHHRALLPRIDIDQATVFAHRTGPT